MDKTYLIWSNEHNAWWAPGEAGYVKDLAKAGRYPRDRALYICAKATLGWDRRQSAAMPELPIVEDDLIAMEEQAGL